MSEQFAARLRYSDLLDSISSPHFPCRKITNISVPTFLAERMFTVVTNFSATHHFEMCKISSVLGAAGPQIIF
jgi:hypothetical protein